VQRNMPCSDRKGRSSIIQLAAALQSRPLPTHALHGSCRNVGNVARCRTCGRLMYSEWEDTVILDIAWINAGAQKLTNWVTRQTRRNKWNKSSYFSVSRVWNKSDHFSFYCANKHAIWYKWKPGHTHRTAGGMELEIMWTWFLWQPIRT